VSTYRSTIHQPAVAPLRVDAARQFHGACHPQRRLKTFAVIADLFDEVNRPAVVQPQVSPVYFDMLVNVCRAHGFAPRVRFEVRSVASQIAYVSCGQGAALVPAAMRRLASANVVVRPLHEKVMVVTAAAAWNANRHHPMVDEALKWLRV